MHANIGTVDLKESISNAPIVSFFPVGFRGPMAVCYGRLVFVKTKHFLAARICKNKGVFPVLHNAK